MQHVGPKRTKAADWIKSKRAAMSRGNAQQHFAQACLNAKATLKQVLQVMQSSPERDRRQVVEELVCHAINDESESDQGFTFEWFVTFWILQAQNPSGSSWQQYCCMYKALQLFIEILSDVNVVNDDAFDDKFAEWFTPKFSKFSPYCTSATQHVHGNSKVCDEARRLFEELAKKAVATSERVVSELVLSLLKRSFDAVTDATAHAPYFVFAKGSAFLHTLQHKLLVDVYSAFVLAGGLRDLNGLEAKYPHLLQASKRFLESHRKSKITEIIPLAQAEQLSVAELNKRRKECKYPDPYEQFKVVRTLHYILVAAEVLGAKALHMASHFATNATGGAGPDHIEAGAVFRRHGIPFSTGSATDSQTFVVRGLNHISATMHVLFSADFPQLILTHLLSDGRKSNNPAQYASRMTHTDTGAASSTSSNILSRIIYGIHFAYEVVCAMILQENDKISTTLSRSRRSSPVGEFSNQAKMLITSLQWMDHVKRLRSWGPSTRNVSNAKGLSSYLATVGQIIPKDIFDITERRLSADDTTLVLATVSTAFAQARTQVGFFSAIKLARSLDAIVATFGNFENFENRGASDLLQFLLNHWVTIARMNHDFLGTPDPRLIKLGLAEFIPAASIASASGSSTSTSQFLGPSASFEILLGSHAARLEERIRSVFDSYKQALQSQRDQLEDEGTLLDVFLITEIDSYLNKFDYGVLVRTLGCGKIPIEHFLFHLLVNARANMNVNRFAKELHRISEAFLSALASIVNSVLLIALRNIIWPGKRNNEYPEALKVKTLSVATIVSQILARDDSVDPAGTDRKLHVGNRNLLVEYADQETRAEHVDQLGSSVADKLNSVVVAIRLYSAVFNEEDLASVRLVLDDESNFVKVPSLVAKLVSENTSPQNNDMDISFLLRRSRGKSLMINNTRSNPWLHFQQTWRGRASLQKFYSESISGKSCEEVLVLMLLLNAYICNMSRIMLNSVGNTSTHSRVPAHVNNLAYMLWPNGKFDIGQVKKTRARKAEDALVEKFKTLMVLDSTTAATTAATATNVTEPLNMTSNNLLVRHCTSNPMNLRRFAATRHYYLIPDLLFSKSQAVQEWREFFMFNLAHVASQYLGADLEVVSKLLREAQEHGYLAEILLQGVSMVCDHSEEMERVTYVKVDFATGSSLGLFESRESGSVRTALKSARDCFASLYKDQNEFCYSLGLATHRLLDAWDFCGAINTPVREADAELHSSAASRISPTVRGRQGLQMMLLRLMTTFATEEKKGNAGDGGEAHDDLPGSESGSSSESEESA
jgi:hypothetical protein